MLRSWLATKRIDAEEARRVNLGESISYAFIDKRRKIFKQAVGPHERGISLGSMRTSATVFGGLLRKFRGALIVWTSQCTRPSIMSFGNAQRMVISVTMHFYLVD